LNKITHHTVATAPAATPSSTPHRWTPTGRQDYRDYPGARGVREP
jgi:hypothetical protein